jgi:hypothetical protein
MAPDAVTTALMLLGSVLPSMLAYFSTTVTYNCKKVYGVDPEVKYAKTHA